MKQPKTKIIMTQTGVSEHNQKAEKQRKKITFYVNISYIFNCIDQLRECEAKALCYESFEAAIKIATMLNERNGQ